MSPASDNFPLSDSRTRQSDTLSSPSSRPLSVEDYIQAATAENTRRAAGARVRPEGGTEPQNALQQAITQRPDIIFFMSDGVIPEETVALASLCPPGTVIHTICFQIDRGERLLRAIADAGGGRYRFVD